MTALVVVCTDRLAHPQTVAEPEDVMPKPPGGNPVPSLAGVMAGVPRRKRHSPAVVYRCPYVYPNGRPCGRQSERLSARRLGRLLSAQDAAAEAPAALREQLPPVDISFM
ncbi:MAG: hypothetical protein ACLP52_11200 [Streptosporangiaceae bacterium]